VKRRSLPPGSKRCLGLASVSNAKPNSTPGKWAQACAFGIHATGFK
jgi:hypothetical protein